MRGPGWFLALAVVAQGLAQAPGRPKLDMVVLEIAPQAAGGGLQVDPASLREAAETLLVREGVKVMLADVDPANTHHLRLEAHTRDTGDGLQWFAIGARWSRTQDLALGPDAPGQPRRVWSASHLMVQVGTADLQEHLMLNLRKTLQDLFDRPLKPPPEHGLRRETAAVSRRDFSLDNVKRVAQNVPFEQVKVRKQPPAPAYPQAAKEAGVQGVVAIEITVGPDGRPTLVEALSGPPALYSTALRYALGWEFEPALLKGAPQAVRFQLTMPFRLR